MHKHYIGKALLKKLNKLSKKDKKLYEVVMKKIEEIINNPSIEHYKNLKNPKQHQKRVHITKSFVLVFQYHKTKDFIEFIDFDHHDKIY